MAVRHQEDVMRDFISTYQRNPCLWKVKSKEYMDRNKREDAYQLLVDILKEINPDANTEVVKKKINSMRSCFRKEYRKVLDSKRSGAGGEDIYAPTLWYFDLLIFLKDQEAPRNSLGTQNPDFVNAIAQSDNDDSDSDDAEAQGPSTPHMPPTSSSPAAVLPRPSSVTSRRQTKRKRDGDDILQVVGDKLQTSRVEDEFDIVGKNVAEKLRKLDPKMRIFAEKLLNDTFFEAQLGTLNRYAHITIPQPSHYSTAPPPGQSHSNVHIINRQSNTADTAGQYLAQFTNE